MFGLPMLFLYYTVPIGEEEQYFSTITGFQLIDSVLSQYAGVLGGFETEFFEKQDAHIRRMSALFFLGATFFAQIIIFNMLIAIMADIFERLSEAREAYEIKNKLHVMKEFKKQIKEVYCKDEKQDKVKKNFLVAINVLGKDDDMSEWDG